MKPQLTQALENGHLREELLERYSLGTLLGAQVAVVEEHVLVCEACQEKLGFLDSWVTAIRRTGVERQPESESLWRFFRFPRLVPAFAAALTLLAGAAVVSQLHKKGAVAPLAVALEATRGDNVARVPARQPLLIEPGIEGLPQFSSYRLEIVDQAGKPVRQSKVSANAGGIARANVSGLPPGIYFVRVYSPPGDLLREYAMEAQATR